MYLFDAKKGWIIITLGVTWCEIAHFGVYIIKCLVALYPGCSQKKQLLYPHTQATWKERNAPTQPGYEATLYFRFMRVLFAVVHHYWWWGSVISLVSSGLTLRVALNKSWHRLIWDTFQEQWQTWVSLTLRVALNKRWHRLRHWWLSKP